MKYIFIFVKRLYRYSGRILYINLIGMSLISLFDGAGIIMLIPLISSSGLANFNVQGGPLSNLYEIAQSITPSIILPMILGIYILMIIGQNLLQKKVTVRNVTIIQGFIHQLRKETYSLLLHAKWELFIHKRRSDLINLFTTEIGRVTAALSTSLQLSAGIIYTVIQIGLACWLSARITIIVLIFGLILGFFSKKFINKSKQLGNKTSKLSEEYLAGMTDQLNGIKDIKSNALERSRIKWLDDLTKKMLKEQVEYIELKTSSQLFYKISSAIAMCVFLYISFNFFHQQPLQFFIIIAIFTRLWPRITSIQSSLEQMASTIPACKAFLDLQFECKEVAEFKENEHHGNVPLIIKKGLQCKNVSFRYNTKEDKYALLDIHLHIPANHMTAIVGPSGAGKSTLIDILMGLNYPERGQVMTDGLPLTRNNIISLRNSISYVPQEPFLFNASIRENLLMMKLEATEEEIWQALSFSSAAEFVQNLPAGLDTLIGDRGIRLSGGERQRLVLARAILKKRAILVLDEATSALDTGNEL
ncbi:MAG: ABC transporter ATP-binding protein, partial [Heyndrickxia sp.]